MLSRILGWFLAAGFVAIIVWLVRSALKRLEGRLAVVAQKRGGEIETRFWYPRLRIPHGGRDVFVNASFGGNRQSPPSSHLRWYKAFPYEIRVCSDLPGTGLLKDLGLQDLETGDAEFDRAFIVQGPDAETARRCLPEPVRSKLLALRKWSVVLALGREGFDLRVPGVSVDSDAFDAILDAGLELIDLIGAGNSTSAPGTGDGRPSGPGSERSQ